MKVHVVQGDIVTSAADVLLVSGLEDGGSLGGAVSAVDDALGGEIRDAITAKEFEGKFQSTLIVRTRGRLSCSHVVVVGLGKKRELTRERLRQCAGVGVKAARLLKARSVASVVFGAGKGECKADEASQAVIEGALLAAYTFDGWKKKKEDAVSLESFTVTEIDRRKMTGVERGASVGEVFASATIHARDLVNESGQHMLPKDLKKNAEAIAKKPRVSAKIMSRAEVKKLGMNAFLAVAQGSENEPYFIHLTYKPKKPAKRSIALVGKGITFDSGGLSLKPSSSMETMKCDMGGAAAVLGVFSQITELEPTVEVHGIIATCENMPSGSAYRPGDTIRAKNGTTIEVLNTDAEGRVTMADSLSYASELEPDAIIDLATLTGACVVALGEEMMGLMTNNGRLAEQVFEAAEESGEEIWELPLYKKYDKLIESKIADVKNIGGSWGGALTAGLFLQKFVDKKIPWVHLDIAGPAFAERDYLSYVPYGGTGAGVRTLLHLLKRFR